MALFKNITDLFKDKEEESENNSSSEEYYIKNTKSEKLNEKQLFGISLGLIIAEQNGAYVNSLEVGKTDFNQKQMMQRNWGIFGHDDAVHFIETRTQGGFRNLYNRLLDIYISQDCVDAANISFAGTEFEINGSSNPLDSDKDSSINWMDVIKYLENLDEVYELEDANPWLGDMEDDLQIGTDAWDLGRIVFVCRVCYSLGYLSETQTWTYIDQIASMAKQKFSDWEKYATSYLIGRAMWSGDDGEWEAVAGYAADALDAKDSPWPKLKWK